MSASNRRQPTRSARTATTRPSNYYARPTGWARGPAQEEEARQEIQHGFFPAITHFTDGLAALPKEVMRQFTLLKESEGKAFPPEQAMGQIIDKINQLPPPPLPQSQPPAQTYFGFSLTNSINGSAPGSVIDGHAPAAFQPQSDASDQPPIIDEHFHSRREYYFHLRSAMTEMVSALDEKNVVLTAINDTLTRQLSRLEGTLPHVEKEISEEARLGSNTHWALPHMREARKVVGQANDRNRRDMQATNNLAAAAAAVHEHDIAAVRSEARREAMSQRRRNNVDSDFDARQPAKRAHASNKAKRPLPGPSTNDARGATKDQPVKKRRVDKGPAASERSMAAAINRRLNNPREPLTGFREAPGESRKKPRPAQASTSSKKKYAHQSNFPDQSPTNFCSRNLVNSPSLASSPTRGTFSTATRRDYSPAAPSQRPTRPRQDSNLSGRSTANEHRPRNGSASYHNKTTTNGTYTSAGTANTTSKGLPEVRSGMKDVYTHNNGHQIHEQDFNNTALTMDGSSGVPSRTLKREETEFLDRNNSYPERHHRASFPKFNAPLQSVETADTQPMLRARNSRGNGNSISSKAPPRLISRSPAPTNTFPRRAHEKRYTGRSSPASALTAHLEGSPSHLAASEDEGADSDMVSADADPDEPRYCFCNQTSHGFMVACDDPNCDHEWFHLDCVGLKEAPPENTKWYCRDCEKRLRGRSGGR